MAPIWVIFSSMYIFTRINNAQEGKGCMLHLELCPIPGQTRQDAQWDANWNFLGGCQCGCYPPPECRPPSVVAEDCTCTAPPTTPTIANPRLPSVNNPQPTEPPRVVPVNTPKPSIRMNSNPLPPPPPTLMPIRYNNVVTPEPTPNPVPSANNPYNPPTNPYVYYPPPPTPRPIQQQQPQPQPQPNNPYNPYNPYNPNPYSPPAQNPYYNPYAQQPPAQNGYIPPPPTPMPIRYIVYNPPPTPRPVQQPQPVQPNNPWNNYQPPYNYNPNPYYQPPTPPPVRIVAPPTFPAPPTLRYSYQPPAPLPTLPPVAPRPAPVPGQIWVLMPATTPKPTMPQVWQAVPLPTAPTTQFTPSLPTMPIGNNNNNPRPMQPTPKPVAAAPVGPKPTYPLAVAPENVECTQVGGTCGCKVGTLGTCTITCGGQDGCKDTIIECNNNGFPCVVDCIAEQACSGAAGIIGPVDGSLRVNCLGEKSCEGSLMVDAEKGTDLIVLCDGITSCKQATFNFGSGEGLVKCNGMPDSCIQAQFNLLPNAYQLDGAAFGCIGDGCPLPPDAPEAFNNIIGPQEIRCMTAGDCGCKDLPTGRRPGACTIICDGVDACKDGLLTCNDGYDCIVNCLSENACSGSAEVVGPRDAGLRVNCLGGKACEGSPTFNGEDSKDMSVMCDGHTACKGGVSMNFGMGNGKLECNGRNACEGAFVEVPPDALSFECSGTGTCPASVPQTFNNNNGASGNGNGGPVVTPVDPVQFPAVEYPRYDPIVSASYCCRTAHSNLLTYRGYCWGMTTELSCNSQNAGRLRCNWTPNDCFAQPPVCAMRGSSCIRPLDCCSESCSIMSGLCD